MDANAPLPSPVLVARPRFVMHECLGRGGFGEVYRATRLHGDGRRDEVAVKVLHGDVAPGDTALLRLRDEAQILEAITHPAILRVHDLLVLDGRVALVSELLDGEDLAACVRGGSPLPARAAVEAVGQVAGALHAAWHGRAPGGGRLELVHRDIKPANIRVCRSGAVRLLDFGIARSDSVDREARTGTDYLVGSYLYMAPERFLEKRARQPSDVYSLGCTLLELLTGQRLFGDCTLRDVYTLVLDPTRHAAHLAPRLAAVDGLGPGVRGLVEGLLAYDAGARPAPADVARTCERIAEGLGGPGLQQWCATREWPAVTSSAGMLTGRTLHASRLEDAPRPDGPTVPDALLAETATLERPFVTGDVTAPRRAPWVVLGASVGTLVIGALGVGIAAGLGVLAVALGAFSPTPIRPRPPEASLVPSVQTGPDSRPTREERVVTGVSAPLPVPAQGEPTPVVPEPAPAPADTGDVRQVGPVAFRIGQDGVWRAPGAVPPGRWSIEVDFGAGPQDGGTIAVVAGQVTSVQCKRISRQCEVVP